MASLSQQDERLPKGTDLIWLALGQRSIEKALKLLSEVCELWGVLVKGCVVLQRSAHRDADSSKAR